MWTKQSGLCCDPGLVLDKVIIDAFDADKGTLTPHGTFDSPKGGGAATLCVAYGQQVRLHQR